MDIQESMTSELSLFSLPSYNEIPNVGLFLEQTTKYISEYLAALDGVTLTGSMISNYVKNKLIANPVKKQYSREQIAYLFFIAVAKSVLPLEDIKLLFDLQKQSYSCEQAYEYFRSELKGTLARVFGLSDEAVPHSDRNREQKALLRYTVTAVAHKVYLEKYLKLLRESREA